MEMTNAYPNRKINIIPEFFFYQIQQQTVSSPLCIPNWSGNGLLLSSFINKKQLDRPVTTQEQLMLISAFFGFSKSKLGEIFGVTRQSIYNWFNNTEPVNEHYTKIKHLSDVAFEIDPEPTQQLFHVYVKDVISGFDKSLFDYLLEENFDHHAVVKLAKTIYEMSKARWKRIDAIPDAKYGSNELSVL